MAKTDRHAPDDRTVTIRFPRSQQDLKAWLDSQDRSRAAVIVEALTEKRAREQS